MLINEITCAIFMVMLDLMMIMMMMMMTITKYLT